MPDEPNIPDRLRDDLRRAFAGAAPADRDEQTLRAAIAELGPGEAAPREQRWRMPRRLRFAVVGSGVAAAAALGLTVYLLGGGRHPPAPLRGAGLAENAPERRLAEAAPSEEFARTFAAAEPAPEAEAGLRTLRAPAAAPAPGAARRAEAAPADVNGDGVVDVLDVHALALAVEHGQTTANADEVRALLARIVALEDAS